MSSEAARRRHSRTRSEALDALRRVLGADLAGVSAPSVNPIPSGFESDHSKPQANHEQDFGRAWWGVRRDKDDLLWTRHVWEIADNQWGCIEFGVDRDLFSVLQSLSDNSERVLELDASVIEHRNRLASLTPRIDARWQTRPACYRTEANKAASAGADGSTSDPFALRYAGMHADARIVLAPLTDAILRGHGIKTVPSEVPASSESSDTHWRTVNALTRFVQSLPYSIPQQLDLGVRHPVLTLAYRLGDCDSKALLLAAMLTAAGIPAGVFVSTNERHALAAVSLPVQSARPVQPPPEPSTPTAASKPEPQQPVSTAPPQPSFWSRLRAFFGFAPKKEPANDDQSTPTPPPTSTSATAEPAQNTTELLSMLQDLADTFPPDRSGQLRRGASSNDVLGDDWFPAIWSSAPTEHGHLFFLPIETTAPMNVGEASLKSPNSWTLIPLPPIIPRQELRKRLSRTDDTENNPS